MPWSKPPKKSGLGLDADPPASADLSQSLGDRVREGVSPDLAIDFGDHPPKTALPPRHPDGTLSLVPAGPGSTAASGGGARRSARTYDLWALGLGSVVFAAAVALTLMVGARFGLFSSPAATSRREMTPTASESSPASSAELTGTGNLPNAAKPSPPPGRRPVSPKSSATGNADPAAARDGEMVVYEKGKVVFRIKPAPPSSAVQSANQQSGTVQPGQEQGIPAHASPDHVWLAPNLAESRIAQRVEPEYPEEARAAHRTGDVVLEVEVAEDGSVTSVRTLAGDPLLAEAAATAVRSWRYRPYAPRGQPTSFQTDVTLRFSLPQ